MNTAETAATVAAVTSNEMINNTLGSLDWIYLILGIGALVAGIYEIVSKRVLGRRNDDYTAASLKKFSLIDGICYIVIGGGAALSSACMVYPNIPQSLYWIGTVIIFVGLIADGILGRKLLVEKDKETHFGSYAKNGK